MNSNLTVRIPEHLKQQLQDLCARQNRPLSDVVRDSLQRYLAIEKFQGLRRRTLPFAEARGLLTDEDIFEAVS
ncbi:MAG: ribbon-helix-helix protein, CopG family [Phycisphaerales bacterium]|nr:ribbon-helix-helix protein, CopG family [Phycisphaerales bacterium]